MKSENFLSYTSSASSHPRYIIMMMHGYGAHPRQMQALASVWKNTLGDALFCYPPGPLRQGDGGYAWMPIVSWDLESWTLDNYHDHVVDAASYLKKGYRDLRPHYASLGARVVWVGFSQGAALALYMGLCDGHAKDAASTQTSVSKHSTHSMSNRDASLPSAYDICSLGVVSFSGFFMASPHHIVHQTPTLWVHGSYDNVCPVHLAYDGCSLLKTQNISCTLKEEDNVHTISSQGVVWAQDFICGLVSGLF